MGELKMASEAQTPLDENLPIMVAWHKYIETEEFKNSKHWAMRIAPMIQTDDPNKRKRIEDILPHEMRDNHVQGALWAAFYAGWEAAKSENK